MKKSPLIRRLFIGLDFSTALEMTKKKALGMTKKKALEMTKKKALGMILKEAAEKRATKQRTSEGLDASKTGNR